MRIRIWRDQKVKKGEKLGKDTEKERAKKQTGKIVFTLSPPSQAPTLLKEKGGGSRSYAKKNIHTGREKAKHVVSKRSKWGGKKKGTIKI